MPQKEIELILTRQLASLLIMPTFLVDPRGTLLFYNEAAEVVLGRRFEETGEMPAEEWTTIFKPEDEEGNPLESDAIPLMRSLKDGKPAHRAFWIVGLDGVRRQIEATSFALIGQERRVVGGVAFFWEVPAK